MHVEALGIEIMAHADRRRRPSTRVQVRVDLFRSKAGQCARPSGAARSSTPTMASRATKRMRASKSTSRAMAGSMSRTGIDMLTLCVESGKRWGSGLRRRKAENGQRRLEETRRMIRNTIEGNKYLQTNARTTLTYQGSRVHGRIAAPAAPSRLTGVCSKRGQPRTSERRQPDPGAGDDVVEHRLEKDVKGRSSSGSSNATRQHDHKSSASLKSATGRPIRPRSPHRAVRRAARSAECAMKESFMFFCDCDAARIVARRCARNGVMPRGAVRAHQLVPDRCERAHRAREHCWRRAKIDKTRYQRRPVAPGVTSAPAHTLSGRWGWMVGGRERGGGVPDACWTCSNGQRLSLPQEDRERPERRGARALHQQRVRAREKVKMVHGLGQVAKGHVFQCSDQASSGFCP